MITLVLVAAASRDAWSNKKCKARNEITEQINKNVKNESEMTGLKWT